MNLIIYGKESQKRYIVSERRKQLRESERKETEKGRYTREVVSPTIRNSKRYSSTHGWTGQYITGKSDGVDNMICLVPDKGFIKNKEIAIKREDDTEIILQELNTDIDGVYKYRILYDFFNEPNENNSRVFYSEGIDFQRLNSNLKYARAVSDLIDEKRLEQRETLAKENGCKQSYLGTIIEKDGIYKKAVKSERDEKNLYSKIQEIEKSKTNLVEEQIIDEDVKGQYRYNQVKSSIEEVEKWREEKEKAYTERQNRIDDNKGKSTEQTKTSKEDEKIEKRLNDINNSKVENSIKDNSYTQNNINNNIQTDENELDDVGQAWMDYINSQEEVQVENNKEEMHLENSNKEKSELSNVENINEVESPYRLRLNERATLEARKEQSLIKVDEKQSFFEKVKQVFKNNYEKVKGFFNKDKKVENLKTTGYAAVVRNNHHKNFENYVSQNGQLRSNGELEKKAQIAMAQKSTEKETDQEQQL